MSLYGELLAQLCVLCAHCQHPQIDHVGGLCLSTLECLCRIYVPSNDDGGELTHASEN